MNWPTQAKRACYACLPPPTLSVPAQMQQATTYSFTAHSNAPGEPLMCWDFTLSAQGVHTAPHYTSSCGMKPLHAAVPQRHCRPCGPLLGGPYEYVSSSPASTALVVMNKTRGSNDPVRLHWEESEQRLGMSGREERCRDEQHEHSTRQRPHLPRSSCRLPPSQEWLKKRPRLPLCVASMLIRTAALPLGSHSRSTCGARWGDASSLEGRRGDAAHARASCRIAVLAAQLVL